MLCNSSLSIQWNYIYFQQMAHKILFYLWMRWSLTINNCINTENITKSLYGRAILFNILSKIYLYLALKLNKTIKHICLLTCCFRAKPVEILLLFVEKSLELAKASLESIYSMQFFAAFDYCEVYKSAVWVYKLKSNQLDDLHAHCAFTISLVGFVFSRSDSEVTMVSLKKTKPTMAVGRRDGNFRSH